MQTRLAQLAARLVGILLVKYSPKIGLEVTSDEAMQVAVEIVSYLFGAGLLGWDLLLHSKLFTKK